jgi:predicted Ser/Thr protein kinase
LHLSAASPTVRRIESFLGLIPHSNNPVLPPRPFGGHPLNLQSDKPNLNYPEPYKNFIHNGNDHLLSNPKSVTLPMSLNMGNRKYTITKFIAQGSNGAIYEGSYQVGDKTNEVIFKVYTGGIAYNLQYFLIMRKSPPIIDSFNNEKNALSKLGRLIDVDDKNMILVMPKIAGSTLEDILDDLHSGTTYDSLDSQDISKLLLQKYLRLPWEFREKWGLAHMNVHPGHVIVDDNGDMHLIDFSTAKELKEENAGAKNYNRVLSGRDDLHAMTAAHLFLDYPGDEMDVSDSEN